MAIARSKTDRSVSFNVDGTTSFPRLGLCCQFAVEPIRFRTTTAASLLRLNSVARREKISQICMENSRSLKRALEFCGANQIGCFRVISTILPCRTHPEVGYRLADLPAANLIVAEFESCRQFAEQHHIRTVFHPDQFVVLNSLHDVVLERSIEDLEYHGEIAELIGADVINIHGGGAYGDRTAALERFAKNLDRLSSRVRSRLTVENDDKIYSPAELLPICRALGIPLVYDVHHHRCLPDQLTIAEATRAAIDTWNREPLFHLTSPLAGWGQPHPERHHAEIDFDDFPQEWLDLEATIEIEAKGKEIAVLKLLQALNGLNKRPERMNASPQRGTRKKTTQLLNTDKRISGS